MSHGAHNSHAGSDRPAPERTCIGCRRQTRQEDLLRLVRSPDGAVVVDHPRRLGGRGAYVCSALTCFGRALRPALLRKSLGGPVAQPDISLFAEQVRDRLERRVIGLLAAAGRARKAAVGSSETRSAIDNGTGALVVVASDVSPRVRHSLEEAARRASIELLEFGDRQRLGDAFARSEVGAVAVTEAGLAAAIRHEIELLDGLRVRQEPVPGSRCGEDLERAT